MTFYFCISFFSAPNNPLSPIILIERASNQRVAYKNGSLYEAKKELLSKIGFDFTSAGQTISNSWQTHYKNYTEHVKLNGAHAFIPKEKKAHSKW